MRIDPSQLSQPLAHILGAGATDAAAGQQTAKDAASIAPDPQLEQLDELLRRRMQLSSTANAASSVVSFQDAQERMASIQQQMSTDPAAASEAMGQLDSSRVRGLLGD